MIEIVSIRFKNRGKSYYFAPNGLQVRSGDKVIVETAKGLEIAEASQGNHMVEDTAVIQPLRPVVRMATTDDLRVAELNKKREQEAMVICRRKIAEHGLEMKLVDAECNFEGTKTTFFFTADGRVDFRELVKDLAGVFRNRIELRQIGVRDEAKMIGGIGICGRPYCCHQFLEDFQPVSTKMAKVQSLSLNPTKISGSCGRLMCCLRYEQEAYEDLLKRVPKQDSFVETIDGYGTAVQVNLLRQNVKVRLDGESEDSLHLYKARELAQVPGGRPKDGMEPPHVLEYVPEEPEPEEEPEDNWSVPVLVVPEAETLGREESGEGEKRSRRKRNRRSESRTDLEKQKSGESGKAHSGSGARRDGDAKKAEKTEKPEKTEEGKSRKNRSRGARTVKVEAHTVSGGEKVKAADKADGGKTGGEEGKAKDEARRRRNYHHRKPKSKGESPKA